jgi:hypothetical protein
MQPHFVRIKLVKGNLSLYYVEPYNPYKGDFMIQANEMAKPYIKEGWHLVHAMMVDYHH